MIPLTRMFTSYVQSRLSDENVATRVTVLAAMRHTFADSSPSYDEILAPHILDFFTLMSDPALVSGIVTLAVEESNAGDSPFAVQPCRPSTHARRRSLISSASICRRFYRSSTARRPSSLSSSAPSRWAHGSTRSMTALTLARPRTRHCTLW